MDDASGVMDEPMVEEMSKINWHRLSEQEAVSFGCSVSMLRDAEDELLRQHNTFKAVRTQLLAMAVVLVIATWLGASGAGLVAGVMGVTVVAYLVSWYRTRSSRQLTEGIRQSTMQEISSLAEKHPLG